jgi:hypothetical protein
MNTSELQLPMPPLTTAISSREYRRSEFIVGRMAELIWSSGGLRRLFCRASPRAETTITLSGWQI